MRICSMLHTFVALMAVLIFNLPFTALAQQKSVQTETEVAAEQDSSSMMREAKTAAERDASNDINKLAWWGAGARGAISWGLIGASFGFGVGCLIDFYHGNQFFYNPTYNFTTRSGECIGPVIGIAIGGLAPLIGIYRYQGNPPPERLVGKSPEYVEFYTAAYQAKTRSIRTKWATAGGLIGVGVGLGLGCLAVFADETEGSR